MKTTKNYFRLATMMLVAIVCFGFVSCGDDDKDDFETSTSKESSLMTTLFEEPFVDWGTMRSTVRSTVTNKGYKFWKSDEYNNYYFHYFYGKYEEDQSVYVYTSSYKLCDIYFYFLASKVSTDRLKNYLTTVLGYSYVMTDKYDNGTTYWRYEMPSKKSRVIVTTGKFNDGTATTELYYFDPSDTSARELILDDNSEEETIMNRIQVMRKTPYCPELVMQKAFMR